MTRHIFTLPQILPKSVRLAGAEWRGRFTHMPIYGARLRMTRHILADKWQPAFFFPYLFLHRIAVSVEILHPETLARSFLIISSTACKNLFLHCWRNLLFAVANYCRFDVILRSKTLASKFSRLHYTINFWKSLSLFWLRLVAFCSKTDFLLFFLKNTETRNYHILEPHGYAFLAIRKNNNTIIDL